MARTYRYGYGTMRLTEAELDQKWSWRMVHPEVRRRSIHMFDDAQDAGHDLGCGGGARDPVSQEREFYRRHYEVACPGQRRYLGKCYNLRTGMAPYAPPGSSNHETGVLEGFAIAIDYVGWEDHWFDEHCEKYGIKNFGGKFGPGVNGEEWHGQPVEFANARSAVNVQVAEGKKLTYWDFGTGTPQPPTPLPPQKSPERIVMAESLEFTTPYRWDTRGFGVLPPGQYECIIPKAAGKAAIKGNLTVVPAGEAGYATAWIGNTPTPNVSALNWNASDLAVANQIDVPLAPDGSFKIYIHAPASIIFDLVGFWS